jgi:branched-chain amino acid transport system permease protein
MGRDLAVGPPEEIRNNPMVHTAYLGVKDDEDHPAVAA